MLVYDQPINRTRSGRRTTTRAPSGFDLFALFSLLWRRKTLITCRRCHEDIHAGLATKPYPK